jgi:hypothetical protein
LKTSSGKTARSANKEKFLAEFQNGVAGNGDSDNPRIFLQRTEGKLQ